MKSSNLLSMWIFAIALFIGASAVRGQVISRDNPYRSFNISGINYGSQQWERNHRTKQFSNQQPSMRQPQWTPRPARVRIRRW